MEKLRILIVDDHPSNLVALRTLINDNLEVEVIEAQSGLTAIDILMEESVDMIVLDVHMPDMDGFELAELIRKREKTKHIPIIMLTAAYVSEKFKIRGFELGVEDYITKPINDTVLIGRLSAYLRPIARERQLSVELEMKVSERTAQLSEKNFALELEISRRQEAETKLNQAMEELEVLNKELSDFSHLVAHELKTPLGGIIGFVDLVQTNTLDELPEDARRYFEIISENAYHLVKLIDDMLLYAKSARQSIRKENIDPNECIREITDLIGPPQNVSIQADKMPMVHYDHMAMHKILQNLISNGIKYNDKEFPIIKIWAEQKDGKIIISVSDNGRGISEVDIDNIYKLFYSAGNSQTSEKGTGIGLAVVKTLVERNGGTIWCETKSGEFTCFSFSVPL
ncbi:MAG: hybrid sensor histidine kinase/response regulator [Bacteroidales bacterium]|nr:hybrid sensor histidine kinase/response regulator [Bacteroidales bacterium]